MGEVMMKQFLMLSACFALVCSGCADSSEESDKTETTAWFFVNYTTYEHVLHIAVNGKEHVAIKSAGSGFDSKPSPLKEGKNTIFVRFEQRPEEIDEFGMGSKARIFLSPTQMVGSKPLPGVEITDVEGYCECEIEVVIKDNAPVNFRYVRMEWVSDKKKIPLYEEWIEKGAFSEVWKTQVYKTWTDKGAAFSEEFFVKGKLDRAKYYRPDGKIGAEVKGGKGIIRKWYSDGMVEMEVPVLNGMRNGVMKEYSVDGKVASETKIKDGKEINAKQE